MSAPDLFHANLIAREMVLALGMGRRMGPLDLMHVVPANQNTGMLLRSAEAKDEGEDYYYHATDMSTEQSRVALAEVVELLEAAEAKAYYGLALNWKALQVRAAPRRAAPLCVLGQCQMPPPPLHRTRMPSAPCLCCCATVARVQCSLCLHTHLLECVPRHTTPVATPNPSAAMRKCRANAHMHICVGGAVAMVVVLWRRLCVAGQALTEALLERSTLSGQEVARIVEGSGGVHFPDPYTTGYGWKEDGEAYGAHT